MITIQLQDREVLDALNKLRRRTGNLKPAMQDIGELLVVSTKERFKSGTAPDGSRWASNTEVTELQYLRKRGAMGSTKDKDGKKVNKKWGKLTKSGMKAMLGKRPLIGESRRLGHEIYTRASNTGVEVGSPLIQAGVMQFGAKARSFTGGRPWGDIPARPFLGLSTQDRENILDVVAEYLANSSAPRR
jgi:phage gpG-like protein